MEEFIKAAKYNFPKLINTDLCDFTSSHLYECKLEWFKKLEKNNQRVMEEKDEKEGNQNEIPNQKNNNNNKDITIFWQTAIMVEGNELAFYRLHVVIDVNQMMHVYFLRYERSSAKLKFCTSFKKQFKDYESDDLIDHFSSSDIHNLILQMIPLVNDMRNLYISDKNFALYFDNLKSISNQQISQYIQLQEDLHFSIEQRLQSSAETVLNTLKISDFNLSFTQFLEMILPLRPSPLNSRQKRSCTVSYVACLKRIIGSLFIHLIREKSFPKECDFDDIKNYYIWDRVKKKFKKKF